MPTGRFHHVVEHARLRSGSLRRQFEVDFCVIPKENFHFGSVIQFEEGADAPHQNEHVEPAVVILASDDILLIVERYEALEKITRLANDERFEDVHLEGQVLDSETQQLAEGTLEQSENEVVFFDGSIVEPSLDRVTE